MIEVKLVMSKLHLESSDINLGVMLHCGVAAATGISIEGMRANGIKLGSQLATSVPQ